MDPAIIEEYRQFLHEQNEKILVEVRADFWKVKSYSWALVARLIDVSGLARERTIILLSASIPAVDSYQYERGSWQWPSSCQTKL